MDTGVRDLEVAFFKANSTWFNDICSKNLSNRLIYAVLNTHNLGMILQLKDMLTVMNPVRIASSDWKSYKCYGLWYALSLKRVRWPPDFFYVFNLVLSFSTCSQSFNKICVWEVLGANVLKLPNLVSWGPGKKLELKISKLKGIIFLTSARSIKFFHLLGEEK